MPRLPERSVGLTITGNRSGRAARSVSPVIRMLLQDGSPAFSKARRMRCLLVAVMALSMPFPTRPSPSAI